MQKKSSFSLGTIKNELNANALFSKLSETQKNSIVNSAVIEAANFRYLSDKKDYLTDTNPDSQLVGTVAFDMMNYFLNGTIDWESTNLIIDENHYLFTNNIDEQGA